MTYLIIINIILNLIVLFGLSRVFYALIVILNKMDYKKPVELLDKKESGLIDVGENI